MNIHYLVFASKEEAFQLIVANMPELLWDDNGEQKIRGSHSFAVDLIGTVYKPTGVLLTSDDGFKYPELEATQGYHININLVQDILPDFLTKFEVFPTEPSVTWG